MTDTRDAVVGSYDDFPESEVATVLEVPLLWQKQPAASTPSTDVLPGRPRSRHRSARNAPATSNGRHRAALRANDTTDTNGTPIPGTPPTVTRAVPPRTSAAQPGVASAVGHTLRVGAISAALVLTVCAAVLLAIARWLP